MNKLALLTVAVIFAVTAALFWLQENTKHSNADNSTVQLKPYYKPELLTEHLRPKITIDENINPRWVKSLDESSLRGSTVDRPNIRFDSNGITKLSPDIPFYFSYFTSLSGEMSPQRIRQLVYDDMFAHYPKMVANEFYDLFDRYLRYQYQLGQYINQLTPEAIQEHNLSQSEIEKEYQQYFFSSNEINALFIEYNRSLDFRSKGRIIAEKLEKQLIKEQAKNNNSESPR